MAGLRTAFTHTLPPYTRSPLPGQVATCTGCTVGTFCLLPSSFVRGSSSRACVSLVTKSSVNECCAYEQSRWCVACRSGRRPSAFQRGCLPTARQRKASGMASHPQESRRLLALHRSPRARIKLSHQYLSRRSVKS